MQMKLLCWSRVWRKEELTEELMKQEGAYAALLHSD